VCDAFSLQAFSSELEIFCFSAGSIALGRGVFFSVGEAILSRGGEQADSCQEETRFLREIVQSRAETTSCCPESGVKGDPKKSRATEKKGRR